jgi:hypothetical protein
MPEDDTSMWVGRPPPEYGDEPKLFWQHADFGRTHLHMNSDWLPVHGHIGHAGSSFCELVVVRAGIPFRAFEGSAWAIHTAPAAKREWLEGAITLGPNDAVIPMTIRWHGLVLNTVAFSLILWITPAGLRTARRRHRTAKGRCPACGYPAGPTAVCSECGASVTTE